MKNFMQKIDSLIDPLRHLATCFAAPVLDLAFRLYPSYVFFKSGLGRLRDFRNDTWDTQIFLFDMEHPVPYLSPDTAAYLTMAGELILPVLLALGLFGRVGAAGILIMALVIEFTYQHNMQHWLWIAMSASIFIKGPGKISLDYFIVKWLRDQPFFSCRPTDKNS